jgi:hypothetical protein
MIMTIVLIKRSRASLGKNKRIKPASQITFIVGCLISACTNEPQIKRPAPSVFLEMRAPEEKGLFSAARKATAALPDLVAKAVNYPAKIIPFKINFIDLKNQLVGLKTTDIKSLLGKPKFTRVDLPGKIWQFQSNICFIDLFLYKKKGAFIVTHVDTRSNKIKKVNGGTCFASLLKTRRP